MDRFEERKYEEPEDAYREFPIMSNDPLPYHKIQEAHLSMDLGDTSKN